LTLSHWQSTPDPSRGQNERRAHPRGAHPYPGRSVVAASPAVDKQDDSDYQDHDDQDAGDGEQDLEEAGEVVDGVAAPDLEHRPPRLVLEKGQDLLMDPVPREGPDGLRCVMIAVVCT